MAKMNTTTAQKPLAREIAAYTDEELDKYLEENGRIVSVQDPVNISSDFIQRLRDKVQRSREAAHSCAVDLDQVVARLYAASAVVETAARSPQLSPTPPLPSKEEQDIESLRREMESYPALVEAGGRPPYPFHLLEDFFKNPEQHLKDHAYRNIILFWRGSILHRDERTLFCACHLLRWRRFCRLQRIIRKRSVKNEWTLMDAAESDSWEEYIERFGPKEGEWGFPEYVARVKERLSMYGLTRKFQLDEDLTRQDKMTTWIEYLGYEHWFYNRDASYVKRFQRRHDQAWMKLVDSGLLRPGETYEVVCDSEAVFKRAGEGARAEKAMHSATTAALSAKEAFTRSMAPGGSRTAQRRRLLVAQSRLKRAKAVHEMIKRRSAAITDFIQRIKGYRNAQDDAERQNFLLRWIQQQLPLIELESNSSKSKKGDINCGDSGERLNHGKPEQVDEGERFQTQRYDSGDSQSASKLKAPTDFASQGRGKRKHSSSETVDDSGLFKRPRNSVQSSLAGCSARGLFDAAGAALDVFEATKSMAGATREPEGSNRNLDGPSKASRPLRRSSRIAKQNQKAMTFAQMSTPSLSMIAKELVTRD